MRIPQILLFLAILFAPTLAAQTPDASASAPNPSAQAAADSAARAADSLRYVQAVADVKRNLSPVFRAWTVKGYKPTDAFRIDSLRLDTLNGAISVFPDESFCSQLFTEEGVRNLYERLNKRLPDDFADYSLTVRDRYQRDVRQLVPNYLRTVPDASRQWGEAPTAYPWVVNTSRPYKAERGLEGIHLAVTPSHGRYLRDGQWTWQRPHLFCTTEDLFTQSIVFPYLIPMLERAGAVVASARERDSQTFEAVVDNDAPSRQGSYEETSTANGAWTELASRTGFAPTSGLMSDTLQPFTLGTVRQAPATRSASHLAQAAWTPRIPHAGRYAVYVSYATATASVPDAHYIVYHSGEATHFRVNQRIGGGTWVYLGTFAFAEGESAENCVVLTNQSDFDGTVTADAVRFGGGVGQTAVGESGTSGVPRQLEAARYYVQYAGLPDSLFTHDTAYKDDIRARSLFVNHFGGGNQYLPAAAGGGVPFELSLAVHSDAGVRRDNSVFGTLGIVTAGQMTEANYPAGISRLAAYDLSASVLSSVCTDLSKAFGTTWTRRELWDRNYGESRSPEVPATIIETLSHQNFGDMKYGHDPNFKFALARAIYKGVLRYVNASHGRTTYDVQPLPPHAFSALLTDDGQVRLSWQATPDSLSPSAQPTGYIVYTRKNQKDFDNGRLVGNVSSFTLPVDEGVQYDFRISAVNAGGESFPTEILTVCRGRKGAPHVLIVNAFDRLSGPAWVTTADSLGFDLRVDLGVPLGSTNAFAGYQTNFSRQSSNHGLCGDELLGRTVVGNTQNFPALHAQSILAAGAYSISSCSQEAFETLSASPTQYDVLDYICGLQRRAPQNLRTYPTFTPAARRALQNYVEQGGNVLVSGAFVGTDLQHDADEKQFLADVLHCRFAAALSTDSLDSVAGLNTSLPLRTQTSSEGYTLQRADVLEPADAATFSAFAYPNGHSAGIAYQGNRSRTLVMGFPFESIATAESRNAAMGALLAFLVGR